MEKEKNNPFLDAYNEEVAEFFLKKHLTDIYKLDEKYNNGIQLMDEFSEKYFCMITVKYNNNYYSKNPVSHLNLLNKKFKKIHDKITSSIISGNKNRLFYKQPLCRAFIDIPGSKHGKHKSQRNILSADHHHAICHLHHEIIKPFYDYVNSSEFSNFIRLQRDIISVDILRLDKLTSLINLIDYSCKVAKFEIKNIKYGEYVDKTFPVLSEKNYRNLFQAQNYF